MSEITPDLVRHLGVLARIQLSDEEVHSLTGQLDAIVDNIAKVSEVATPDVVATSHPVPLQNVFRPDVVGRRSRANRPCRTRRTRPTAVSA